MKKLLFIFSVILLYTNISFSQSDSKTNSDTVKYQTDEVVISGTRTEKKLIDIPYPVDLISKKDFEYSRNLGINDVLGTTPGLFLQSRYGNHDVRISIRGFGSRSNTGIRGVRILQDGIPESEPDGQTRIEAIDFNALGSIEVVRGNASALYTNAPGGVINFISDIKFYKPFVWSFNEFGEFGMKKNSLKFGLASNSLRFMSTFTYTNYDGYRVHSNEYQKIFNSSLEAEVGRNSNIGILTNFVSGAIRLPGSLTLTQYTTDPLQANPTDKSRDAKRDSKKGRLAVRYNTMFGKTLNNLIEATGYIAIKDFDRTAKTYRLFSRYGLGGSFRYVNKSQIGDRDNEFSVGGDVFYQTGPIEEYENIGGTRGDILLGVTDETITNGGAYFSNQISIVRGKLDFLFTGRYDNVGFIVDNRLNGVRSASRSFSKFTPKFAFNYKLTPYAAIYTSFGLGFDTPAFNELDNYPLSSDGNKAAINPDLNAQTSTNFEIGTKGNFVNHGGKWFKDNLYELVFYRLNIENEIVPFVVSNTTYFRNAAKSNRTGIEFGLTTNITGGLKLKTAYNYSDFKYDSYTALIVDINGISTTNDYSGNIAPSVPKHYLSSDLSYEYNFTKNVTGFAKFNYTYVEGMFTDDGNSAKTESYILLNSGLGMEVSLDNFSIIANAGLGNITDKKYVAFININADPDKSVVNRAYYESGAPKNFYAGINLGYIFR
ncbi:MAG: TonB-dependent receptor [Bacteroidetes bacterium]|nr:TonB-dependent receptor [Bacteroidota bacterium]